MRLGVWHNGAPFPFGTWIDRLGGMWEEVERDTLRSARALARFDGLLLLSSQLGATLPDDVAAAVAGYVEAGGRLYVEGWTHERLAELVGFRARGTRAERSVRRLVVWQGSSPVADGFEPMDLLDPYGAPFLEGELAGRPGVLLVLAEVLGTYRVHFGRVGVGDPHPALISPRDGVYYATLLLSRYRDDRFVLRERWERLAFNLVKALGGSGRSFEEVHRRLLTDPPVWVPPGEPARVRVEAAVAPDRVQLRRILPEAAGNSWELIPLRAAGARAFESEPLVLREPGVYELRATWADGEQIHYRLDVSDRQVRYRQSVGRNLEWLRRNLFVTPDGTGGVYERVESNTRSIGKDLRPDCIAETAAACWTFGKASGDESWMRVGRNLAKHLYDGRYQDRDAGAGTFGFWNWMGELAPGQHPENIFTDDNTWASLVGMVFLRETGDETFGRALETVRAFQKTLNAAGCHDYLFLRGSVLNTVGPVPCRLSPGTSVVPHYNGMPVALYPHAWAATGDGSLLRDGWRALELMLASHPIRYGYDVSRTEIYARALLPLAMWSGVSVKAREAALDCMAYLERRTDETGALQEWDNEDKDLFVADSAVFHENGEPIADIMYVQSFALFGLWQLYRATGDGRARALFEKMADFLVRIQIADPEDPLVDGGWKRSFDYRHWEWYGSPQDPAWGPYVMESGWCNAVIDWAIAQYLAGDDAMPRFDERACPLPPWAVALQTVTTPATEGRVPVLFTEDLPAKGEGHGIALFWRPPEGPPPSGYRVYRSSTFPALPRADHLLGEAESPAFVDRSAQPGTWYFYVVTAVRDGGDEGPPSACVAHRSPRRGPVPAPRHVELVRDGQGVRLRWEPPEGTPPPALRPDAPPEAFGLHYSVENHVVRGVPERAPFTGVRYLVLAGWGPEVRPPRAEVVTSTYDTTCDLTSWWEQLRQRRTGLVPSHLSVVAVDDDGNAGEPAEPVAIEG
ncbi:MAG: hypothetical protein IMX02_01410 [Limnochordaceae bacterium]|nr:hypothetical protein [Limnochordaceae bacterium]